MKLLKECQVSKEVKSLVLKTHSLSSVKTCCKHRSVRQKETQFNFESKTGIHPLLFVSADLVALVDMVCSADMLSQLVKIRKQIAVIVLGEQIVLECPGSAVELCLCPWLARLGRSSGGLWEMCLAQSSHGQPG